MRKSREKKIEKVEGWKKKYYIWFLENMTKKILGEKEK